jgi:predicted dehydrogenase
MGKLKVGLVGLSRGAGLVKALATHPRVEVAALCDVKEQALADLGAQFKLHDNALFTRYHEFVKAPLDIVVIATPIEYHAQQSIQAMESGKHVLCEQTAAYTVDDCDQLIKAVRRTGKVYMMAENYTYFHYIREWQKLIAQGKLGQLYYAEAEYIHEIEELLVDPVSGEQYWRYRRPPIWYCAHCLGPLLTLMDDRIVRVTGLQAGRNTHPNASAAFIDMEVGLFQTAKGRAIKILRSQVAKRYEAGNAHLVWYSIYGTEGFIEAGRESSGKATGLYYTSSEMTRQQGAQPYVCLTSDPNAPAEAKLGGHGTSEFYMVRDFIAAIDNHAQPVIDVVKAVDFTLPGLLAHESAMKGGVWLDVPQLG